MISDILEPKLEYLSKEYVLVQAWKKTAAHIRAHNWYADTLELDRATVDLPRFLGELAERLRDPDGWKSAPLRIVPAPKSQRWRIHPDTKRWEPVNARQVGARLRPLAHASLSDQVAATALMLCLADAVETHQGDSRLPISDASVRKRVVSYGNRLVCDDWGEGLRHRWGSSRLYRAYFQDYRTFLSRPETAAHGANARPGERVVVLHSDLRRFYDCVRHSLVHEQIEKLAHSAGDEGFFQLARRVLQWTWDARDAIEVNGYARSAGLAEFSQVTLPQGLVAAGFFANVALLDVDQALRVAIDSQISAGITLVDVCRYVDDFRLVLSTSDGLMLEEVEQAVTVWLGRLLDEFAAGLRVSEQKTSAALLHSDERPLVRQSRKMARIQAAVSGGFDAIGGEEILDAVQGLIRSQERYSEGRESAKAWSISPVADVRDETVARFAAGRFRSTYRALRPLLPSEDDNVGEFAPADDIQAEGRRVVRTTSDLDDDARAFALGLIENWVQDPSNVRLLRIGLDLWPAVDVLQRVLDLLKPFTMAGGRHKAPRRVAWYCLAEIFRAGAIETGSVEDDELLPEGVDVPAYRQVLRDEAVRLAALPPATLPWYLRQQVLLFLAVNGVQQAPVVRDGSTAETLHYQELIRFLRGEGDKFVDADFAVLAVLARRSFRGAAEMLKLIDSRLTLQIVEQVAERDPSFAIELLEARPDLVEHLSLRLRHDLCIELRPEEVGWRSLISLCREPAPSVAFRNELSILSFASKFLGALEQESKTEFVAASDVLVRIDEREQHSCCLLIEEVRLTSRGANIGSSMYMPPDWCAEDARWRFQLGYLLRYILTGRANFSRSVRSASWREGTTIYRAPEAHRYERLHGMYNGHSAFGDDWLPISDWLERLLSALLAWPGCRDNDASFQVCGGANMVRAYVDARVQELLPSRNTNANLLMLPLRAPRLVLRNAERPLRACVVQTVIPSPSSIVMIGACGGDLTLSDAVSRRAHRGHLAAALSAVERMLALRDTHMGRDGRLDWLILPELAVHPRDIATHLIPFSRAHKTIIFAGLTYEELFQGQPLVNSAIWIIPEWSTAHGLQMRVRRQGKQHLAPEEEKFNVGSARIQGFRPCQWLIGYEWSGSMNAPPLWLTGAVCYDATDLLLVTDLRDRSDVFAVTAMNKDVNTFDQMAASLHYHMYQYVVVANNGTFGGSNAYAPFRDAHTRQVFHLHGQPQASIAFFEIDDISTFLRRKQRTAGIPVTLATGMGNTELKWPPAGTIS